MTVEEKREILSKALVIQKEIDRLSDHLCDIENGAIGSVSYGDKVQTSPPKGSAADTAVELSDEIREKEQDKRFEAEIIKRQLERQSSLSEKEQKLLSLRYVRCLPWKEVACLLGCTKRHSYRIEKRAVSLLSL